VVELRGSFNWPVFFAGGLLAVLFRNAGRRRKVRCRRCDAVFSVASVASEISRGLFWLCLCPAILAVLVLLITLLKDLFSH
jgi:hypothetical protein